jgi:hypothetical protein
MLNIAVQTVSNMQEESEMTTIKRPNPKNIFLIALAYSLIDSRAMQFISI